MSELQNKARINAVILLLVIFIVMLFIAVVIRVKEREKDSTLYELYDPIEPQEIRDFRNQIK